MNAWNTLLGLTSQVEPRDSYGDIFDRLLPTLMNVAHIVAQRGDQEVDKGARHKNFAQECSRIEKELMALRTDLILDNCEPSLVLPTSQHLRDQTRSFAHSPLNAKFWASLLLAEIVLIRSRPQVTQGLVPAIVSTRSESRIHAEKIGEIVQELLAQVNTGVPITPEHIGALNACLIPFYFAAVQYDGFLWRNWCIQAFATISKATGWHVPLEASVAVQLVWVEIAAIDEGSPWQYTFSPEFERQSCGRSGASWGMFARDAWNDVSDDTVAADLVETGQKTTLTSEQRGSKSTTAKEAPKEAPTTSYRPHLVRNEPSMPNAESPPDGHYQTESDLNSPCSSASGNSERCTPESDEDYTSSDSMEFRGRAIVDRVMQYFHVMFRKTPTYGSPECVELRTHQSHTTLVDQSADCQPVGQTSPNRYIVPVSSYQGCGEDGGEQAHRRDRPETSTTCPTEPSRNKEKRRRSEDNTGQSDDEAPPKRPRNNASVDDLTKRSRKLACPYFKRSPQKYLSTRSCVGPGWIEVRRVK
jgi:hypothetical protein